MPFVRLEGWDSFFAQNWGDQECDWQERLACGLRDAFMKAEVPRIDTVDQVKVRFGAKALFPRDKTLTIFMDGLFVADDRPEEMRDRLMDHLCAACTPFLSSGWSVWIRDVERGVWKSYQIA